MLCEKRDSLVVLILTLLWEFTFAADPIPTSTSAINPTALYPRPSAGYGWKGDDGGTYGRTLYWNYCDYPIYLWSVGAHKLGGPRDFNDSPDAYSTDEDRVMNKMDPNSAWGAKFRTTCPRLSEDQKYCPDEDKVAGQGVSLKISKAPTLDADITQFEYHLEQAPGDTFKRLRYDVSLIDCAKIAGVTDADATEEQHNEKIAKCPGYKGGISVSFGQDEKSKACPVLWCDGKEECNQIYTWEWTERKEASFQCEREFRGDMTLALCGQPPNTASPPSPAPSPAPPRVVTSIVYEPWVVTITTTIIRSS